MERIITGWLLTLLLFTVEGRDCEIGSIGHSCHGEREIPIRSEDGMVTGGFLFSFFRQVGVNSDSGLTSRPASFDGIEQYNVNKDALYSVVAEW